MMKTIQKTLVISVVILFSSCVTTKQFEAVEDKLRNCNDELKQTRMELEAANTELKGRNDLLEEKNKNLNQQLEEALYNLNTQMQKINALERELADSQRQLEALSAGSSEEIEKLLEELQVARENLNQREDRLREAEEELEERNARLIELQNVLAQKDQAVQDLKKKVMDALVGFNNQGLTVHEKNGKVYVSLEEKLLFKTGQWNVDPRGQEAIRELGKVLAQNTDINIMVEGHTDDVPMHGSGAVKDNWDLSVMRATAVTKILTQNETIDPARIIAAGRSEYIPLASNEDAEGRQMNRRTEIILTPDLDELLEIIEMN
jgi:chemotaxis protein MotB